MYCDSELQVGGGAPLFESELPLLKQYERFTNAKLVTECQAEYESNQFARLRAKNGFCLVFPEELVSSQREILSTVPNHWTMSPLRD